MIVCFSNLDWGYLRYRKQHLMERLSRRRTVVYVNPPRACKWRKPFSSGATRVSERLTVVEPLVLPGVRRIAPVKAVNDRLIASSIRSRLSGSDVDVLWIYSPHAARFIDLLKPRVVVYDIADEYTAPGGTTVRDSAEALELKKLERLEQAVLARADLVVAVSEPLAEKARKSNSNVHLVPNGCDFEAYEHVQWSRRTSGRPQVGYVGTIAPRFDIELVFEAARMRPGWDFVLVGPVTREVNLSVASIPWNVRLAGAVPYSRVPQTIGQFDVAILPLRQIPFAERCSPIQVFDYLAAGKPVVASPVEQLRRMWPLVATATNAATFVRGIEGALGDDTAAQFVARRKFARDNSWDARVEQVEDLLATLQASRRGRHGGLAA